MKNDVIYNLCKMVRTQFLENMKRVKKDHKQLVKYGVLLVCILFYIQKYFLRKGKVEWSNNMPIITHIGELIRKKA